ncbi:sodium-dependent phosphate transporter 1-B-like, partial [Tropilaelaps mercedesae]
MDVTPEVLTPFQIGGLTDTSSLLPILIIGFIVSFLLAFSVGANDAANSFGTSVGAKVLTLRQALILATILEMLGIVLIGYKVSDTMRRDVFDTVIYQGDEKLLMLGCLSALFASSLWIILATLLALPISTSHSVIGATIGFTTVAKGFSSIQWSNLMTIVASWIASPILSGIISTATFFFILKCVVQTDEPAWNGLLFLPLFYFLTLFTNIFPVLLTGSSIIRFRQFPVWLAFIAAVCLAISGALFVWIFFVPRLKFAIQNKVITGRENRRRPNSPVQNTAADLTTSTSDFNATTSSGGSLTDDEPEVNELFSPLQVLTAIFGAFAHGGNDASNAVSPLVTLWVIYRTGSVNDHVQSPLFLFVFGGVGICVGFWVYGQKVITTLGERLTKISAVKGFSIEIGSATTVLAAS